MVYLGAGTRSSPIAIDDDSEDDVFYELSSSALRPPGTQHTARDIPIQGPQPQNEDDVSTKLSSAGSWQGDAPYAIPDPLIGRNNDISFDSSSKKTPYPTVNTFILDPYSGEKRSMAEFGTAIGDFPDDWLPPPPIVGLDNYAANKKRKRTGSFADQEMSTSGRSNIQSKSHTSLANRLSQPESKKARKRRRRAERQAIEEARLQNSAWADSLNIGSSISVSLSVSENGDVSPSGFEVMGGAQPSDIYFSQRSPSPNDSWVSSMAMAAEKTSNVPGPDDLPTRWSPLPSCSTLPPTLTPPAPIHALPPKPPAPQSIPPIGMKPDQDPNSKHGIFRIEKSNKEAGTDMKKRNQISPYIPNPARTLVVEQLPKTHRNVDFIYKWSRSACGALPVHLFIDSPNAKALVEFATAELARKAWSSPKLGLGNLGLKPHQLKGKPREDQIKVWWYRVDGVGAGAGVGEIEEGEIEGDSNAGEAREVDLQSEQKETKKERKTRLAREREEKRKLHEKNLAPKQQQLCERQSLQPSMPPQETPHSSQMQSFSTPSTPFFTSALSITDNHPLFSTSLSALALPFQPIPGSYLPGMSAYPNYPVTWSQQPNVTPTISQSRPHPSAHIHKARNGPLSKTAFGASLNKDGQSDEESIASSASASTSTLLSVKEREALADAPRKSRSRARNAVMKSAVDVENNEIMQDDMNINADPALNVRTVSTMNTVGQDTPGPNEIVRLDSLPSKPVQRPPASIATSAPGFQRPQLHAQSSASSVVPMKNNSPPSPRYRSRKVPQHQVKTQAQPQHQRFNSHSLLLPSRPPTAPRSANVQQQRPAAVSTTSTEHSVLPVGSSSSSSSSSLFGSARSTPTPSEPKAMRVRSQASSLAPPVTLVSTATASSTPLVVRPNMTKEALLARQKDLEERIARSREELAASSTPKMENEVVKISTTVDDSNGISHQVSHSVPSPAPVRPAMDLGEKQALEDHLRKKVLQSQRAKAAGKDFQAHMQTSVATESTLKSPVPDLNSTASLQGVASNTLIPSSTSTSHVTEDGKPSASSKTPPSAVSLSSTSAHSFSLEDLAVSFITQTIETMKSQPGTPAVEGSFSSSNSQPRLQRQSSNQTQGVKLELAAKQRRLEQHIAETKALMARLTQARTKEEKNQIMKIVKEKNRLVDEEEKALPLSNEAASSSIHSPKTAECNSNPVSSSIIGSRNSSQSSLAAKATSMNHQFQITRWPVTRHGAGVLILSDDEEEGDEDDEDGAA